VPYWNYDISSDLRGLQARGAEHLKLGAPPCSWEQLLQPLSFNQCFINFSLDCTTAIV